MAELTVIQFLTGARVAVQRRDVPSSKKVGVTVLTVENIAFAVLDAPCVVDKNLREAGPGEGTPLEETLPENEVIEVTFPSSLDPDINPGSVRFLDELFGQGFVAKVMKASGWEASIAWIDDPDMEATRIRAMTQLRDMVVNERKTGITIGQVAHLVSRAGV